MIVGGVTRFRAMLMAVALAAAAPADSLPAPAYTGLVITFAKGRNWSGHAGGCGKDGSAPGGIRAGMHLLLLQFLPGSDSLCVVSGGLGNGGCGVSWDAC